jgi:hypothetical protein
MNDQPIRLDPWMELVGILQGLNFDKWCVYVEISNKLLSFSQESLASEIALNSLRGIAIGTRIGILFTNLPDKPVIIRVLSTQRARKDHSISKTGIAAR